MKEVRECILVLATVAATIAAIYLAYQNTEMIRATQEMVQANWEMVKANREMARASLPPLVDMWLSGETLFLKPVTEVVQLRIDAWQMLVDRKTAKIGPQIYGPENMRDDYKGVIFLEQPIPNKVVSKNISDDVENILRLKRMLLDARKEDVRGDPNDLEPFLAIIASYRDSNTKNFHRECRIVWVGVSEKGERILWSSENLKLDPIQRLISSVRAVLPCL